MIWFVQLGSVMEYTYSSVLLRRNSESGKETFPNYLPSVDF